MKYTKIFKTESDYELFKEGDDWITPNISVTEENVSIKYNIIEITFTFLGNSYRVPKGTTWIEWYQMGGAIANGSFYAPEESSSNFNNDILTNAGAHLCTNNGNGNIVSYMDEIQDNMAYATRNIIQPQ